MVNTQNNRKSHLLSHWEYTFIDKQYFDLYNLFTKVTLDITGAGAESDNWENESASINTFKLNKNLFYLIVYTLV